MGKRIAFIFVAVAILHANGQYDEDTPKCPENSHYSYCASANPTTCAEQYIETYMTMQCVERCDCDVGYVLSNDGERCVRSLDCKPEDIKCYEGQGYSTSGNQLVCDEVTDTTKFAPGCYCPDGLYFDIVAEKCVEEANCTKPVMWDLMGDLEPIEIKDMAPEDVEYQTVDYLEVIELGRDPQPIETETVAEEEQPLESETEQPIEAETVPEEEQPIEAETAPEEEQPIKAETVTEKEPIAAEPDTVAQEMRKEPEQPTDVEAKVEEPNVDEEPKEVTEAEIAKPTEED